MNDDEDTIIKTLVQMRDRYERARYIESVKQRFAAKFGDLRQAQWYLGQILNHAAYKDKIGQMVTLPFSKALFPREEVERMAAKALADGDTALHEQCMKALKDAKPADTYRPSTMQPAGASGSYLVPFNEREARRPLARTQWRAPSDRAALLMAKLDELEGRR